MTFTQAPAERAARLADLRAVLAVIKPTDLPLPFSGPDRSAFYFTDRTPREAREAVGAAKCLFDEQLGVTWHKRYAQHSNGRRVIFFAKLDGGLMVELVGRAEDIDGYEDEDTGVRVPELAGSAA
jgi:hypothetical protein